MPDLSKIPEVTYDPLNPYHYTFDNAPLKNILTRIDLVNNAVDLVANMLRAAVGSTGSLATRLDTSLDQAGHLNSVAIDSALHNVGAHYEGEYEGISYVRYTKAEHDKLSLMADGSTNLQIQVQTISNPVTFTDGLIDVESSQGIYWTVSPGNALRANLAFPVGAIHKHYYDVAPVDAIIPPDYASFKTATTPVPYREGSLRVLVNGIELSQDEDVNVPLTPARILTPLHFATSFNQGTFSLNRAISATDIIRIEFDTPIGTNYTNDLVAPGAQGATGPVGPQGPPGQGAQGPQGFQGIAGPNGSVGPVGPQGFGGPTGNTGPVGNQGFQGASQGDVYTNPDPTPVAIGGVPAGTTFDSLSMQEMWDLLLYPYVVPTFSTFIIQGQAVNVEVGTSITGIKTFLWTTTTPNNVTANTIGIVDQTTATNLASGLADDGTEAITLPAPVQHNVPATHTWQITGGTSVGGFFAAAFSVHWYWSTFYGPSGSTTLDAAGIQGLTGGQLDGDPYAIYPMGPGGYKYICYPDTYPNPSFFRDSSSNFDIAMCDVSDDPVYSYSSNGFSYSIVTVTNSFGFAVNYRVHRTKNVLGGSINIQVG